MRIVRRLYLYAVALVSLEVVVWGVIWLARTGYSGELGYEVYVPVTGADSGNQFGDYNGLSGYGNAFFPSWTDRRNAASEEIWTGKVTDSGGGTTTYSLSGTVTLSGSGLSGVTVTAGSGSATTDSNGAYTITGLATGSYTVTPSKSVMNVLGVSVETVFRDWKMARLWLLRALRGSDAPVRPDPSDACG